MDTLSAEAGKVIVGQRQMIERVLIGLLANGHVLLEGVPGLAKTLTVRTFADGISARFQRIQFTPDLLPADLVGTMIYNQQSGEFTVRPGPIFANVILADEINRAPAKVQSALLEVMQEHQVTIGHETHYVPDPFLVMATQNPIESEGTYPLPEAQVDRFMLKILVDYPLHDEELTVVHRSLVSAPELPQVLSIEELRALQKTVDHVYVDPALVTYSVKLASASRNPAEVGLDELAPYLSFGASPRGPISLIRAARALAVIRGRDYVLPPDVDELAKDALRHRLVLSYEALAEERSPDAILDALIEAVTPPPIDLSTPTAA